MSDKGKVEKSSTEGEGTPLRRSNRLNSGTSTTASVVTRRTSTDVSTPKIVTRRRSSAAEDVENLPVRRSSRISQTKTPMPDLDEPSRIVTRRSSASEVLTPKKKWTKSSANTDQERAPVLRCASVSPTNKHNSALEGSPFSKVTLRRSSRRSLSLSPSSSKQVRPQKSVIQLTAVSEDPSEASYFNTADDSLPEKVTQSNFDQPEIIKEENEDEDVHLHSQDIDNTTDTAVVNNSSEVKSTATNVDIQSTQKKVDTDDIKSSPPRKQLNFGKSSVKEEEITKDSLHNADILGYPSDHIEKTQIPSIDTSGDANDQLECPGVGKEEEVVHRNEKQDIPQNKAEDNIVTRIKSRVEKDEFTKDKLPSIEVPEDPLNDIKKIQNPQIDTSEDANDKLPSPEISTEEETVYTGEKDIPQDKAEEDIVIRSEDEKQATKNSEIVTRSRSDDITESQGGEQNIPQNEREEIVSRENEKRIDSSPSKNLENITQSNGITESQNVVPNIPQSETEEIDDSKSEELVEVSPRKHSEHFTRQSDDIIELKDEAKIIPQSRMEKIIDDDRQVDVSQSKDSEDVIHSQSDDMTVPQNEEVNISQCKIEEIINRQDEEQVDIPPNSNSETSHFDDITESQSEEQKIVQSKAEGIVDGKLEAVDISPSKNLQACQSSDVTELQGEEQNISQSKTTEIVDNEDEDLIDISSSNSEDGIHCQIDDVTSTIESISNSVSEVSQKDHNEGVTSTILEKSNINSDDSKVTLSDVERTEETTERSIESSQSEANLSRKIVTETAAESEGVTSCDFSANDSLSSENFSLQIDETVSKDSSCNLTIVTDDENVNNAENISQPADEEDNPDPFTKKDTNSKICKVESTSEPIETGANSSHTGESCKLTEDAMKDNSDEGIIETDEVKLIGKYLTAEIQVYSQKDSVDEVEQSNLESMSTSDSESRNEDTKNENSDSDIVQNLHITSSSKDDSTKMLTEELLDESYNKNCDNLEDSSNEIDGNFVNYKDESCSDEKSQESANNFDTETQSQYGSVAIERPIPLETSCENNRVLNEDSNDDDVIERPISFDENNQDITDNDVKESPISFDSTSAVTPESTLSSLYSTNCNKENDLSLENRKNNRIESNTSSENYMFTNINTPKAIDKKNRVSDNKKSTEALLDIANKQFSNNETTENKHTNKRSKQKRDRSSNEGKSQDDNEKSINTTKTSNKKNRISEHENSKRSSENFSLEISKTDINNESLENNEINKHSKQKRRYTDTGLCLENNETSNISTPKPNDEKNRIAKHEKSIERPENKERNDIGEKVPNYETTKDKSINEPSKDKKRKSSNKDSHLYLENYESISTSTPKPSGKKHEKSKISSTPKESNIINNKTLENKDINNHSKHKRHINESDLPLVTNEANSISTAKPDGKKHMLSIHKKSFESSESITENNSINEQLMNYEDEDSNHKRCKSSNKVTDLSFESDVNPPKRKKLSQSPESLISKHDFKQLETSEGKHHRSNELSAHRETTENKDVNKHSKSRKNIKENDVNMENDESTKPRDKKIKVSKHEKSAGISRNQISKENSGNLTGIEQLSEVAMHLNISKEINVSTEIPEPTKGNPPKSEHKKPTEMLENQILKVLSEDEGKDETSLSTLENENEMISKVIKEKQKISTEKFDNVEERNENLSKQGLSLPKSLQDELDKQIENELKEHIEIGSAFTESEDDSEGFLDDEAEEGWDSTPSEGSNDIPIIGESVGYSSPEQYSDESYEKDSFIDDEEHKELLSGTENFDLDIDSPIKEKQKMTGEKKWSRIISVDNSSDEDSIDTSNNKDDDINESSTAPSMSSIDCSGRQTCAHNTSVTSVESTPHTSLSKSNPIIIKENVRVDEITDAQLREGIKQVVDNFYHQRIPSQVNVSFQFSVPLTENTSKTSPKHDGAILKTETTSRRTPPKENVSPNASDKTVKKPKTIGDASSSSKCRPTDVDSGKISKKKKRRKNSSTIPETEVKSLLSPSKEKLSLNILAKTSVGTAIPSTDVDSAKVPKKKKRKRNKSRKAKIEIGRKDSENKEQNITKQSNDKNKTSSLHNTQSIQKGISMNIEKSNSLKRKCMPGPDYEGVKSYETGKIIPDEKPMKYKKLKTEPRVETSSSQSSKHFEATLSSQNSKRHETSKIVSQEKPLKYKKSKTEPPVETVTSQSRKHYETGKIISKEKSIKYKKSKTEPPVETVTSQSRKHYETGKIISKEKSIKHEKSKTEPPVETISSQNSKHYEKVKIRVDEKPIKYKKLKTEPPVENLSSQNSKSYETGKIIADEKSMKYKKSKSEAPMESVSSQNSKRCETGRIISEEKPMKHKKSKTERLVETVRSQNSKSYEIGEIIIEEKKYKKSKTEPQVETHNLPKKEKLMKKNKDSLMKSQSISSEKNSRRENIDNTESKQKTSKRQDGNCDERFQQESVLYKFLPTESEIISTKKKESTKKRKHSPIRQQDRNAESNIRDPHLPERERCKMVFGTDNSWKIDDVSIRPSNRNFITPKSSSPENFHSKDIHDKMLFTNKRVRRE